jgi:hypothetical protein
MIGSGGSVSFGVLITGFKWNFVTIYVVRIIYGILHCDLSLRLSLDP